MVFIGVSSRDVGSGIEGNAPALAVCAAALVVGGAALPVGAPELATVGGWPLTGALALDGAFALVTVLLVVVVVSFPGCEQLETPKVATSAATMKVMLKRHAVQKRCG
jgi:hypothetical protein